MDRGAPSCDPGESGCSKNSDPDGLTPATWQIRFATRTEMESIDNSCKGVLVIEFLDAAGAVLERKPLGGPFRKSSWKPVVVEVRAPEKTVAARFTANIEKETLGRFWIDKISVQPGAALAADSRFQRLMISASRVGNLLYREDPRRLKIELWASEELPAGRFKMLTQVRDYWGQEHGRSVAVELKKTDANDGRIVYVGEVDLSAVPLEIGRYYELGVRVEHEVVRGSSDFNFFAILPEAPGNQYRPEEIPFTARNWDNRFCQCEHQGRRHRRRPHPSEMIINLPRSESS